MTASPRVIPSRLTGQETVGKERVEKFWQWAFSNLLDNTLRGLLAEWLVATATGTAEDVREEWAPYDLRVGDITVEVKSAAYVQSWAQRAASRPCFGIGPTRAWDADSGTYAETSRRQADVYVFCLLAETDPARVNPLDIDQWQFFVIPTTVLDARMPEQKSIALSSLLTLDPVKATHEELHDAIVCAAGAATSLE